MTAALVMTLIGAPAFGYFATSSATVGITIQAAEDFPSEDPQEDEDPTDEEEKVWICKLVGQPDNPNLAEQNNPRQVSASATDNGVFNDKHGSPVVDDGDVDCDDIWPPTATSSDNQDDEKDTGKPQTNKGRGPATGDSKATQQDTDDVDDDTDEPGSTVTQQDTDGVDDDEDAEEAGSGIEQEDAEDGDHDADGAE